MDGELLCGVKVAFLFITVLSSIATTELEKKTLFYCHLYMAVLRKKTAIQTGHRPDQKSQ